MKICPKCGIDKSDDSFRIRNRPRKDGSINITHRSRCVDCEREDSINYYYKNQDDILEKRKIINAMPEIAAKQTEYAKKYYWERPEQVREKARLRRIGREEERREYRKANRGRDRESKRLWVKKQFETNPEFKILEYTRIRIRNALMGKDKSAKTRELIGINITLYKKYLEERFVSGMCWENYGKVWQIDHIIPLSSFNMLDPFDQRMAFNYRNTQPLFAADNIRKNNNFDPVEKELYITQMQSILSQPSSVSQ